MNPALRDAARKGDIESVGRLLQEQPELVDTCDMNKWTALHYASQEGHHKVVELLVARSPNLVDVVDFCGRTSLHYAAREGHARVANLLLLAHASRGVGCTGETGNQLPLKDQEERPNKLRKTEANDMLDIADWTGQTALHLAVQHGREEVAEMLLAHKPELLSSVDNSGDTVLHAGVESCNDGFLERLWRLNLEALYVVNNGFETPFHLVIAKDRQKMMNLWQWKFSFDEILVAFFVADRQCTERVRTLMEALIREPLLMCLNQDVVHVVFDYVNASPHLNDFSQQAQREKEG